MEQRYFYLKLLMFNRSVSIWQQGIKSCKLSGSNIRMPFSHASFVRASKEVLALYIEI